MIYSFEIEQAYTRFIGKFNDLYRNPNKSLNLDIQEFVQNQKNIIINKRNLYICFEDDNYIDVIQIYPKTYRCFKYVTKSYFDKYKEIYNELYKIGLYPINGYEIYLTERLDIYINSNFNSRNILDKFYEINNKYIFNKHKIHDKLEIEKLNFFKENKIKGTFIDYCIRYLINNKCDNITSFLNSCNTTIREIPFYIKNCCNSDEIIFNIFDDKLKKNIYKLKEVFTGLNNCEAYINIELQTICEPDLISDDYIIDIKTTDKQNIVSKKNYLQVVFYAVTMNKKNVCLYDPINGYIYTYKINDIEFDRIQKYLIENKKDYDKSKYINKKPKQQNTNDKLVLVNNNLEEKKDLFSKDELKNLLGDNFLYNDDLLKILNNL